MLLNKKGEYYFVKGTDNKKYFCKNHNVIIVDSNLNIKQNNFVYLSKNSNNFLISNDSRNIMENLVSCSIYELNGFLFFILFYIFFYFIIFFFILRITIF